LEVVLSDVDQLLTVVLVIRDRPIYTRRWMRWANEINFPFNILIADGGKDEMLEAHLRDALHYPTLRYRYLRYPLDITTKDYLSKISNALYQVETRYAVLADDDDFWNVEALRASIKFLEAHLDYSTCRGRNFFFVKNKKCVQKTQFMPGNINDIDEQTASARVMSIYKKQAWTFYDVHRTIHYQRIFREVAEINTHFLPMTEVMIGLMDAAQGKLKRLDMPYLIREDGHGQSTSRNQDHFTRLMTGPSAENLSQICKIVAHEVAQHEVVDAKALELTLHRAFLDFWAPSLLHHLYAFYDFSFLVVARNLRTWFINFLGKKNQKISLSLRKLSERLSERKARKQCEVFFRKNPRDKQIFQMIREYLK